MNTAALPARRNHSLRSIWWIPWISVVLVTIILMFSTETIPWAFKFPRGWQIPLAAWLSNFAKWLVNDFDLGLFTFKELTRSFAWLIDQPYWIVKSLLSTGFLKGVGSYAEEVFPKISWLALIIGAVLLAHYIKGWRLATLVGISLAYLVVFGQWDSAMVTLSSIAIALPFGVAGGLWFGVLGYRYRRFEQVINPVLDLMQTMPVFAYLVPVLLLFGFGPVSAMIATIIYAMPPMVRVTILALRQVPEELLEAGSMAGCTNRQLITRVLLPSARHSIMIGVNQLVMLSLNMVIIASMIGAGGLGHDVLTALKRLKIDEGVEAGLAITLLAITLDRLSQAWANRSRLYENENRHRGRRNQYLLFFLVVTLSTWLLGIFFPFLHSFPETWQVTTGTFWADLVRYININYFDLLDGIKNFLLLNIMIPVKRFLLSLPWVSVVAAVSIAGWQLGGKRLGLTMAALSLFIVLVGLWPKAMVTLYLCGLSVIIAALIGIPVGIVAARNQRVHNVMSVIIDTLQTLPSFVYLMPVVMLFRVGDFAAMLAVIAYAITPAIRYTDHGIRSIPSSLIEVATQTGSTPRQILWKVQLPLALPQIMLGVNQTIMMALSMLVITALVGTRELGQEVYIALTKADTGRGIVAGLSVACIAIISDRLIATWANRRKAQLGLE